MATEKRLIEVKSAWEKAQRIYSDPVLLHVIKNVLDETPTIDAVEVVRCKDCKSWEQYNSCDGTNPHRCMNYDARFYRRTRPDDFCSYGERRTDNER